MGKHLKEYLIQYLNYLMINNIVRYYFTIKDLKLIQIIFLIIRKFIRKKNNKIIIFKFLLSNYKFEFNFKRSQTLFNNNKVHFLNHSFNILNEFTSEDDLISYNLNYFDYLNNFDKKNKIYFLKSIIIWIKKNKNKHKLDSYPTSLRIVNWIYFIKYYNLKLKSNNLILLTLYNDANILYKNIEYHLLGNHLFKNAKALIFAGMFFKSQISNKWLKKGLKIFEKQILEQILKDGGHYELSPMYHSIFLLDLIEIYLLFKINNFKINYLPRIKEKILKMYHWLMIMKHPDGSIPFFNDTSENVSLTFKELENIIFTIFINENTIKNNRKKTFIKSLENSGYHNINLSNFYLIADIGNIAPKFLPGHSHADTLSFELSIFNKKFIVNSGTSTYENNTLRYLQRSTCFHSTLTYNNKNSSDVWKSFRVGKKAYANVLLISENKDNATLIGSHDGYSSLFKKIIHERKFYVDRNTFRVIDSINHGFNTCLIRYYLHPSVLIKDQNIYFDNKKINFSINGGNYVIKQSDWYNKFYHSEKNHIIEIKPYNNKIKFEINI